jgi:hypothetical protein
VEAEDAHVQGNNTQFKHLNWRALISWNGKHDENGSFMHYCHAGLQADDDDEEWMSRQRQGRESDAILNWCVMDIEQNVARHRQAVV